MNELEKLFSNRLLRDEPMSKHSTLRIGGAAKYFLKAKNAEDVVFAVKATKEDGIGCAVIGGGSNILVSDFGFDGLIVKMEASEIKVSGTQIYVDAGVFSAVLARTAAEAGLSGLEWMATLPGTVGGAIYGNSGAFGQETKDNLSKVLILAEGGNSVWKFFAECGFGYRESIFKQNKEIILGAEFNLVFGEKAGIQAKIDGFIAKRKQEQPLGSSSAGCIFKNYEVGGRPVEEVEKNFEKEDLDILRKFWSAGRVPAGWLIERAGLKGICVGSVCVSDKHCNFALAKTEATADQFIQLVSLIKMKVRDTFGIELREEVQYIGF